MKSRASLVLMEQLIMVLVFALAAALCLQTFAYAQQVSGETQLQDRAVLLAQNGAETLKACEGDLAAAARLLGGEASDESLKVYCDELCMKIEISPTETPGLGQAEVCVVRTETGQTLFSLMVGWQEVG